MIGILLLAIGVGLLVWGLATFGAPSAGAFESLPAEPGGKAVALCVAGLVLAVAGCVRMLRRSS